MLRRRRPSVKCSAALSRPGRVTKMLVPSPQLSGNADGQVAGTRFTRTRDVVLVTNIPTPYRLHFCRLLSEALARRGWTFRVWFMAHTERGRYWDLQPDTFQFSHRMFRGLHPR